MRKTDRKGSAKAFRDKKMIAPHQTKAADGEGYQRRVWPDLPQNRSLGAVFTVIRVPVIAPVNDCTMVLPVASNASRVNVPVN
jgi:hypothetical protein